MASEGCSCHRSETPDEARCVEIPPGSGRRHGSCWRPKRGSGRHDLGRRRASRLPGGSDSNDIRVLPADNGDLRFEERNEDVVVDNQNPSCMVAVAANKTTVQCETTSDRFIIEGEALGDSV